MDNVRAALNPEPRVFDLWRHRTKRCQITPVDGAPPFLVKLLDAELLVAEHAFDDHHAACVTAIDALRRAIRPA